MRMGRSGDVKVQRWCEFQVIVTMGQDALDDRFTWANCFHIQVRRSMR
jgi:hypothetical protein